MNDYFDRTDQPGEYFINPDILKEEKLRDGIWTLVFFMPENIKVGDKFEIEIVVKDPENDVVNLDGLINKIKFNVID